MSIEKRARMIHFPFYSNWTADVALVVRNKFWVNTLITSFFLLFPRMNSIRSSRRCCRTCGPSPTPGSTCRPVSANISKSTRSGWPRTKSAPSRMSYWARSPRSNRSGRHVSSPSSAKTSGLSVGRTLCCLSRGRSLHVASSRTQTRRGRWGASIVCGRRIKSGVWIWWWWFCSRASRWRARMGSGW